MNLLETLKITPTELGLLLLTKTNTAPTEYVRELLKTNLYDTNLAEIFEERGWIKYVKSGKKEPIYRLRLSDKGEEILKSLSQKPPHELSEKCWDILQTQYLAFEVDKSKINNKSKTVHYLSEWLYCKEEEGKPYTEKMFQALTVAYLGSFEYEKKMFIPKTLNLLFKSDNVYATKFSKDASPLYTFSELNKKQVEIVYRKLFS